MAWIRAIWARRWLRWLLALAVALGVLGGAYAWLVRKGPDIVRDLAQRVWSERRYPGELKVGRMEWVSPLRWVAHQVSIGAPWTLFGGYHEPLAVIDRIEIELALDKGSIDPVRIVVAGARVRLDAAGYQLLNDLIEAEAKRPSTGPPRPLSVTATGEVAISSGLTATAIRAEIDAVGPLIRGPVTGMLGGEPFRLDLSSRRTAAGAREYTYQVTQAKGDLGQALDAVAALGITGRLGDEIRRWFPRRVDISGTTVTNDPQARTYVGSLQVAWEGGSAGGELAMDRRRIAVGRMRMEDAGLGAIADGGRLSFERESEVLTIEAEVRRAGPRLPIPPEIPRDQAVQILPRLSAVIPTRRDNPDPIVLRLAGGGTGDSQLALRWQNRDELRIDGRNLPLAPARGFLPPELSLIGGTAGSLLVRIKGGRLDNLEIVAAQTRLAWQGWTLGPTDGRFVLVPGDQGWLAFTVELLPPLERRGEPPIAVFRWQGTADAPLLSLETPAVEALASRLRGPVALPDLRGRLAARVQLGREGSAWTGRIQRLETGEGSLAFPDLFRGLSFALAEGEMRFAAGAFEIRGGGQIAGGDVLIAGRWVPAAGERPLFRVHLAVEPGEARRIFLREALLRAGDERGAPAREGWTAQISGLLAGADGAGRLEGVVDRIELPWLMDLVGQRGVRFAGQGAATFTVALADLRPTSVAGSFLPLGAEASVAGLAVEGIIGEIRFSLDQGGAGARPAPR